MQKDDFRWFLNNYADLYEKYGSTYLVIKNKVVLGTYDTYAEAVKSTMKTEKLGSFIVQLCSGTEIGYTNYIYYQA